VPTWIFVLGGFGIVLGLVLFGRKILVAMGTKLTKITPSRGFVIQIVAAFVVTMGSFLELPLSTTHCQVGATIGVGLMEGTGAVNQQFVLKIFGGWVVTLAVTAVSSGVLYLIMIAVLNG
jgi:sodium-dependent phosphate transporter